MDLKPIIATSLGIAIYRAVVAPMLDRYFAWRDGPRVRVARRNWRGVYVPDLGIKRFERLTWLSAAGVWLFGFAVALTVMTSPS